MFNNPLKAYQTVESATLDGRALEASLLIKSAARLAAVQQNWDAPGREELLDESLRYNLRLWTVFQAEMTNESNPIPTEIKRNLLSLSAFIDKRTFDTISYPDPAKLDILIAINRNIAAGLQPAPAGGGAVAP
ncbi:MAG TPA: flagellar biosynthesis regulator FlaF [Methylophilaceae bacterium]|jgi:flagellar protein FlaF|nr:flagellar biosynthesis regulator FlaF [Methylophilaceae bacterium]